MSALRPLSGVIRTLADIARMTEFDPRETLAESKSRNAAVSRDGVSFRLEAREALLVKRRTFITLLGGVAAWPLAARAQQAGKIPRVGFMGNSTAALEANLVGPFRDGLRELGYQEGS